MNINVNKIASVVIKDEDGKCIESFQIQGVVLNTLRDKTQILEIHKAPALKKQKP